MRHHESDGASVVIGAGPAGLAAAVQLRRRGIEPLIVDRSEVVGSSWRGRYDQLRLNSVRWMSSIPGAPMPRRAGRWPSAGAYVAYLEETVRRWRLDIRHGVEVRRVDRAGKGYAVVTDEGSLPTSSVVVATGYDRVPYEPDWPGRKEFAGHILHAADYREPTPYAGRDVLVVGCGNTGTELAVQLARGGAARVRVALRTPPNIVPRELAGVPSQAVAALMWRGPERVLNLGARVLRGAAFGDTSRFGLPPAPMGMATELRVKGLGPVVDTGFVAAVREGRVGIVAAVSGFRERDVELADGSIVRPDVVIAATGYRHGLEELVGHLGVLTDTGRPKRIDGGPLPEAPGLHFNGYWLPVTGQLSGMRATSRRIAREIRRASPRDHGHRWASRGGSGRRLRGRLA